MRERYGLPGGHVRLSRHDDDDGYPRGWWVDWLTVQPSSRGDGIGRRLMEMVIEDADREGERLILCAAACAGPTQAKLEAWYAEMGFVHTGEFYQGHHGPIMVRKAKT